MHERRLHVTSFEELLERDNSVSVYNRNIQCLAIELYKVFNGICPDIMKDVFPLSTSSIHDILAPKVWKLIPNNIKSRENLPKFKKAIKNWRPVV